MVWAILFVVLGLAGGCGGEGGAWEKDLLAFRSRADSYFRGEESPLDPESRPGFAGLAYYPPDISWRLQTVPDRTTAGTGVQILDNRGTPRNYRVHSRLTFRHGNDTFTLTVYHSADEGGLFLPFRDATNGGETYGAGRYVEVEVLPEGQVRVDFNVAKNPYCAYSDRWACPLVPEANVLSIPVPAGEKAYTAGGH